MRNLTIVILATVIGFVTVSCGPHITEDEVRGKIDSVVLAGTSKKQILEFLKANDFMFLDNPKQLPSPPNCEGCTWITASLETWSIWGETYIVADFFFSGPREELIEYRVKTIYPGWAAP